MPGTYQYDVEIKSNVAKLLSDMKQVQDRLDTVEGKEYKIKLNVDEKKLSSVISNLEKMLDSLGKGTSDFKQFENLSKELSNIVSEVQSLSKAFGKVDDSGAKTLLSSIQNIDRSLSELSQHILNVNKNMSNMGGNTGGAVKQVENISNAYQDAAKEAEKLADAQSKIGQKTNISSASTPAIEQQIKSESELNAEIEKRENIIRELQQLQEKLTVHEDFHGNDRYFADQLPTEEEIREADKRIKQLTGTNNIFDVDKLIQDRNEWLSEVKYSLEEYDDLIKTNDQKALDEYTTRGLSRIGGAESFFGYEDNNFSIASKFVEEKEKIQNEINDLYVDLDKLDEKMNFDTNNSSVDNTVQSQEKLQSELKETQEQAEKTAQVVKEVASATASTEQKKDAFPDKDVSASVESATNSIKEENNVLEQNTQKVKENADAKKKLTDTDKEVSNVDLSKYDNRLESYTKKTSGYDTTIARFENGGWTSDTYKQRVNAVKEAVKQYADILNNFKKHPELVNDDELGKLDKQEKLIKDNIIAVQNMSAAEKGYSLVSGQKELDKINNILKEHSGMSREAKNQIKAYYAEIKSGNPSASLDVIHGKIMQIVNAEIEAGRGGKSMFDAIKEKAWYGVASAIGTYFGFNDLIRYGKEGVSIVRQLDTALTEMRKVSNESVQSLKKYQDTTFDTADAVGTTAKQIQNSTADWMRLGESMDTAAKSAKDANILLNVSEFEGIDEATESLVSMSQAYKDLDKMDIIDVLNNIGNNYSISTDGLATALKDSASALVTANNDLNEAVSLTTAGNAITQDPSKVGAGLRTISLRLVGTEEAKEELSDLGEETEGMITTVSKLRNTIQSATSAATKDGKGFDIFDSNGNYKSTYEIMQGLADLYDEIVKKDKELGTNNLNLLLETIAGKNRSNIAASILQNGDMLRSVYEDAQNSEGSAEKELNSYLDSVDGKFQQLQNRTQEFWYNVIDTTTVKSVLDFTTDLTEGASKFFKLVEKHLPTILGAIATIIASNKSGGLIRLINFINNSPFLATVEFNREVYELIV
jgi:TP901 family phage tail tape measure protein